VDQGKVHPWDYPRDKATQFETIRGCRPEQHGQLVIVTIGRIPTDELYVSCHDSLVNIIILVEAQTL
jgi:hypothetical protein